MPAGKGGAGCGAKGFAGSAAGAGVGEGVCANAFAARHELKTIEAANNWKVILRTRFIVAPRKIVLAKWFLEIDSHPAKRATAVNAHGSCVYLVMPKI
jgi:hypothetical protein